MATLIILGLLTLCVTAIRTSPRIIWAWRCRPDSPTYKCPSDPPARRWPFR
jgi:hypothetical protein